MYEDSNSSSYDSSQNDDEQNKNFKVFQHDHFLSGSFHHIDNWKDNINKSLLNNEIEPLKYLEIQYVNFQSEELFLLAPFHIRSYAFVIYLNKAFKNLLKDYEKMCEDSQISIKRQEELDLVLLKLTQYLETLELTRASLFCEQFQGDIIDESYDQLRKIFPFVLNKYSIWRLIMCIQTLREEQKQSVLNIPFNLSLDYYLKTFRTLKSKNQKLGNVSLKLGEHIKSKNYLKAYHVAMVQLKKDNTDLPEGLQCDFLSCIRSMHQVSEAEQAGEKYSIFDQYILSSLRLPYYKSTQNFPNKYYEELFFKTIFECKSNPQLLDLALYIEPNVIKNRSKEYFGKVQSQVLNIINNILKAQQNFLQTKESPSQAYIKKLFQPHYFALLIHFMVSIMQFNKSSFLKANSDIYETFLEMAEILKNIFLSFGNDIWLFPQQIFTPLTLNFFKKISQDINDDLKTMLYKMVQNLNHDKLPEKLIIAQGELKLQKVSRLQYLSAIIYYIDDCSRAEKYINLPQISPKNFQTSVLLVKSLNVKLNHHQPNATQLPLFIEYLKQCQKYKIDINFKWFKQQDKILEREMEFQIQVGLPNKQIRQILRKCLNYRDKDYVTKLIEEDYNKLKNLSVIQIASRLKYNRGMTIPESLQIQNEQIMFGLIEQMQTMLSLQFDNVFNLPLQQEININYVHILLHLYNSKIKDAEGSVIYEQILTKIMLPYMKTPIAQSQTFKKKYPGFFQPFIYSHLQLEVCCALNQYMSQVQEQVNFDKKQEQWTPQQARKINDLITKIKFVRDQLLKKLNGSQDQINFYIITFTSLISQKMPFKLFIECALLFGQLLLKNPNLKGIASYKIFFTLQRYKTPNFFQDLRTYFQQYQPQELNDQNNSKLYIFKHTIDSYDTYSDFVPTRYIIKSLEKFNLITSSQSDTYLSTMFIKLEQKVKKNLENITPSEIFLFTILFMRQLQNECDTLNDLFNPVQSKKKISSQRFGFCCKILESSRQIKGLWQRLMNQLKEIKFKDLEFLGNFVKLIKQDLDNQKKQKIQKQKSLSFKDVWFMFLEFLDEPSWTFHYSVKLEYPALIKIHKQNDKIMLNLIKNQKLTKQSYPVFKNMISQQKKLASQVLKQALTEYELQNYAQNYHFHNKLILINEILPDPMIEEIILKWIQKGQNKLPLKIPQLYYIQHIKKRLASELPGDKLGIDYFFNLFKKPQELQKNNQKIDSIFQVLLYFPVKKFQNVNLSKIEEENIENNQQDEGDWSSGSQQDTQLTKIEKNISKGKQNEQKDESDSSGPFQASSDEQGSQNNDYYQDRPEFLQIFTDQDKNKLNQYKQYIRLREEIHIYLKVNRNEQFPSKAEEVDGYLKEKLLGVIKYLENCSQDDQHLMVSRIPENLYKLLKILGYKFERDQAKVQKIRQPRQKMFTIQSSYEKFSDRYQSQNSNSSDDRDYQSEQEGQDYYDQDQQDEQYVQQKQASSLKKLNRKQSDAEYDLPELTAQFTKIQSEVLGNELTKQQIVKILEIYLIQLFRLSPINFAKNQIVFSYTQIMDSQFSQLFFDSVLTILRINENKSSNCKTFLEKSQKQNEGLAYKIQDVMNLGDFNKNNGLQNLLHLLKEWNNKKYCLSNKATNPFTKQSSNILPVAQKFIIQFNLPIQINSFTAIILYIQSGDKIRQLISDICIKEGDIPINNKQVKKICEIMIQQKAKSQVWDFIEQVVKRSLKQKLIISLSMYSKQAIKALTQSSIKVKQFITKNKQNKMQEGLEPSKHTSELKRYQRVYYIVSNLLGSCSPQIKHFYFINKTIFQKLYEDQCESQYKKVPKTIKKYRDQLLSNQSFIEVTELAARIIYYLKKQLQDHALPKMLTKLIKYPKMILQTANMYMDVAAKKISWEFKPPSVVRQFIEKYQFGEYKFKSLVQTYNLILGLLDMEAFCLPKFKQLLLPYFVKNKMIGLQVPLIFKVPAVSEDLNAQTIFVTRQCSLDMAFLQVNHDSLLVQFHEEEGSDHGGMIRQLMMGWKGVGFGIGEEDFFFGKIMGISFRQTVPYGGYVDLEMCISIANYQVTLQNVEELDKQIYKSLKFIKENDPIDLCLTFSVSKKLPRNFDIQQYELKPNGKNIEVTEKNKEEYIKLYLEKYYSLGRQKQLQEVAIGFYTAVPKQYAEIFKPNQLMQHIRGEQVCDINVLKTHVKYEEGYTESSVIIKWLWEILESFKQEQLNKFVQFLTGSPKIPIFNPNFEILIQKAYQVNNLPISHTCFNTLELPEYPSKEILEKKLITAIFEGNDSFGIL